MVLCWPRLGSCWVIASTYNTFQVSVLIVVVSCQPRMSIIGCPEYVIRSVLPQITTQRPRPWIELGQGYQPRNQYLNFFFFFFTFTTLCCHMARWALCYSCNRLYRHNWRSKYPECPQSHYSLRNQTYVWFLDVFGEESNRLHTKDSRAGFYLLECSP